MRPEDIKIAELIIELKNRIDVLERKVESLLKEVNEKRDKSLVMG